MIDVTPAPMLDKQERLPCLSTFFLGIFVFFLTGATSFLYHMETNRAHIAAAQIPALVVTEHLFEKTSVESEKITLQIGDELPVDGYVAAKLAGRMHTLEKTIDRMSKTLEKQAAVTEMTTHLYRTHVSGDKINEEKAHDLLLRAGLQPGPTTPVERVIPVSGSPDSYEFTHSVVKEIIREEMESFVHKVNLVSEVGKYVSDRINE